MKPLYHYVGAIHIHTTYSDGSKPIAEVIAIGRNAGLDFMLFSDHMTLKGLEEKKEGWYDRTLVLIGYEINDREDRNHLLAFNLRQVLPADLKPKEYVRKVREHGGLGIIAHPDEVRNKLPQYRPYPWNAWDVDGFDGIEIWNQMSEWMEKLTRWNRLAMVFRPRRSLYGPTPRILARWDEYNQKRPTVGTGGIDVHAHPHKFGPFTIIIFPYEVQFKSIRTHVLLDKPLSKEFPEAKRQLLEAIRHCRVFISNYRWGEAMNFRFWAENGGDEVTIGETISLKKSVHLHAHFPRPCESRLIHNGQLATTAQGMVLHYEAKLSGVYRIEAYRKGRGWIYSNHIRVSG